MEIYLFKTNKRDIDLKEVPELSSGIKISVELRDAASILSPTFCLTNKTVFNISDYNYIYAPAWLRAYFINNITTMGNLFFIECVEDYLASWYAEIMSQEMYCLRSASRYNENITDNNAPTETIPTIKTFAATSPWQEYNGGVYVMGLLGGEDTPHVGAVTYYIIQPNELDDFMSNLLANVDISSLLSGGITDTLSGIFSTLCKTIADPIKYIQSLIYLPVNALNIAYKEVTSVPFGLYTASFNTPVKQIIPEYEGVCSLYTSWNINIDTREIFQDLSPYQCKPPFTQLTLYAPPFGIISIPDAVTAQALEIGEIVAEITLDTITGAGMLSLKAGDGAAYITTGQIGIEVGAAQITQDLFGALQNTAGAINSLGNGSIIGAAGGVISGAESMQPSPEVTQANGGYAMLKLGDPWQLQAYLYNQKNAPELFGRPLCETVSPQQLKGFAQFESPRIYGRMLNEEKENINGLLAAGVFIDA